MKKDNTDNLYEILGIPEKSDIRTIRKSFIDRIRPIHPDLNPQTRSSPELMDRFFRITHAYNMLKDPEKLKRYGPKKTLTDAGHAWNYLMDEARDLLRKNQLNDALEYAIAAANIQPRRWQAYAAAGHIFIEKGEFKKAEKWLKKARRRAPFIPRTHYQLWLATRRAKDFKTAWHHLYEDIHLDPTVPTYIALTDAFFRLLRHILFADRFWWLLGLFIPGTKWATTRNKSARELKKDDGGSGPLLCLSAWAILESFFDCC